ncbi:MAG: RIP metalloprotease RseP [Aquificae bacterium]|nr:RIP metalloprotease RseP [Aquificota bacterium]
MLTSVIAFLVLIGVLVWFHEFGHFLMAKLFRVRVEVFSIGFGPAIVAKKVGDTLYQIAAIPLGGYVKLYGEEENLQDPEAFSSKKPWQKILIALGGPVFNFILAVLLFTLVFSLGIEVPKYSRDPVVIGHVERNSWAEKVGLREGDRLLKINGYEVKEWGDLREVILKLSVEGVRKTTLYVERDGRVLVLEVELPKFETGRESLGIAPPLPPVVGAVMRGSPAEQVGLRPGDLILEVNGKKVESWYDVVEEIQRSEGRRVRLKIKRGKEIVEKEVIPAVNPRTGRPFLGITPRIETVKEVYSLPEAFSRALERTKELTLLTFEVLKGLLTGDVSFRTLGGPIAIAQFAGQAAQSGIVPYLSTMAFISLQLGIFNLLPLPILDGGLILLFLIEWIRGRPLSDRFKEQWQKVGLAIIITLMAFVLINDILRVIGLN